MGMFGSSWIEEGRKDQEDWDKSMLGYKYTARAEYENYKKAIELQKRRDRGEIV